MPNPKAEAPPLRDKAVEQKLVALKKEYDELHKQKITTDANIANLEKDLAKLRQTAEEQYGTSDLEKLKEILEARRQDNEAKVAEYEQHVKEIKANLTAIETSAAEDG